MMVVQPERGERPPVSRIMNFAMRLHAPAPALLAGCWAMLLVLSPKAAHASTISTCSSLGLAVSCTGTLDTPEDVFVQTFTLTSTEFVTVQTYGFGGGTNAVGATVPSGGFDPLVALFSGNATNATLLTDGGGNAIASADTLSQFSPGCPPAGTVTLGTVPGNCGDSQLTIPALGPGVYTLLIADANFVPLAVNPGIPGAFDLTDTTSTTYGSPNGAYIDLSGGVFQTCATSTDCNIDTGDFAVDLLSYPNAPELTPEPALLGLLAAGMGGLILGRRLRWWRGPRESGAEEHLPGTRRDVGP